MSEFDYQDVYKVPVTFDLTNTPIEHTIEQKMIAECKSGQFSEHNLCTYFKLNLKNASASLVRTYFAQTYSPKTLNCRKILVRYDSDFKLQIVGGYNRARKFRLYDEPILYTQLTESELHSEETPTPQQAYKIKLNPDVNVISTHPFTETQMKYTYAYTNNYEKALQKNQKIVLTNKEFLIALHDVEDTYTGLLLRFITKDTAHYFKCVKPGLGKGNTYSVFIDDKTEIKKWSPKKHLERLQNICK